MFTFFMIKELMITLPLLMNPLASGQIGEQSKYTYWYNSNEVYSNELPEPNTTVGLANKEVFSYSMPENPTITGSLEIKQKSYLSKEVEEHTVNDNGTPKTDYIYLRVFNIMVFQYTLRQNTETQDSDCYAMIYYPTVPNEMLNQEWTISTGEQNNYIAEIDALFNLKEDNATQFYNSITTIKQRLPIYDDEQSSTYDYLPDKMLIPIDTNLQEGDTCYFTITLEMEMTVFYDVENYPDGMPSTAIADYTKYFNFTQYPSYTYWDITYTYIVDESTYEVIDITSLLLELVVMPFTFISQAFNLTLFAGTIYAVNISRIVFALIVITLLIFIIRKFVL